VRYHAWNDSLNVSDYYGKGCSEVIRISQTSLHQSQSDVTIGVCLTFHLYNTRSINNKNESNLAKSFCSSAATGFKVNFKFFFPPGRPRWDMRTTEVASLSRAYLMVFRVARIRWLLVITPSFKGTLKSTLKTVTYQNENTFTQYNIKVYCSLQGIKLHLLTNLIKILLRAIFKLSITSFLNDIFGFFCFCEQQNFKLQINHSTALLCSDGHPQLIVLHQNTCLTPFPW